MGGGRELNNRAVRQRTNWSFLGRLSALALAGLTLFTAVSACRSAGGEDEQSRRLAEDALGVRVLHVSLTADGGMVDVRYRVTNPERASLLGGGSHEIRTAEDVIQSPLLIDEASGYAVMETRLHQMGRVQKQRGAPQAGLTYFILFSNTGGLIKPGSKVALAVGDARLEHLSVE